MSTEIQFLRPHHHPHHHYGTTDAQHHDGPVASSTAAVLDDVESGCCAGSLQDRIREHDRTITLRSQIEFFFFDRWQLKALLAAVPIAILGRMWGVAPDGALFVASFLGLIPLAALLGDVTEDMCKRTNDVVGALINVTFGNATELIISICALRAGLLEIIKFSLIGSVLGNMLLVLGTAFLVGGCRFNVMTFNTDAANTYAPLLMLSTLSFVIPSGYASMHESMGGSPGDRHDYSLRVSREIAVVSCIVYCGYMFFQLYTHKSMFDEVEAINKSFTDASAAKLKNNQKKHDDDAGQGAEAREDEEDGDDEDEMPTFTWAFGLGALAIISILISFLSDILVATVEGASSEYHLTHSFIGIIVVPIVGNAAEHASAVIMAAKGKMDVAVGVAMGSSIQIASFVMPLLVLVGWATDIPLDMNFHPFLTILLFVSVVVANVVTQDGRTNWLEGFMLLSAYVMISITTLHGKIRID